MTMIESGLNLCPSRDVSRKLHLIAQRKHMIVTRYIDMKHVEVVKLAEIIGEINEARGSCLGNAIVNNDNVLIKIVSVVGCSRVE